MKTKIFCGIAALALFVALQATAQIQYITLHPTNLVNFNYAVQTNQIITLVGYDWTYKPQIKGTFPDGTQVFIMPTYTTTSGAIATPLATQIITGLTNILIAPYGFATFKIETPATANYIPANAVVIPTDATGPVQIILESSADLVNWTSALPGTYGSSATNRFFRVRAVANP